MSDPFKEEKPSLDNKLLPSFPPPNSLANPELISKDILNNSNTPANSDLDSKDNNNNGKIITLPSIKKRSIWIFLL